MITSEITNSPIVATALKDYYDHVAYYDVCLRAVEPERLKVEAARAEVLRLVKEHGGYKQDGMVAYIEDRVSYAAQVALVKAHLAQQWADAVIVEAVNDKALEGLRKGGLITSEEYDACRVETKRVPAFICSLPKQGA